MKKFILGVCALAALASCQKGEKFNIEGVVANGEGKTIYLESVGINALTMLDSVVLKADGSFQFKQPSPTQRPEYYQLRVGNQFISLAIDSTETLTINADTLNMSTNYVVEGSVTNDRIRRLNLSASQLRAEIEKHVRDRSAGQLPEIAFRSAMDASLSRHKEVAKKIVFEDLRSSSSYYAIYQNVNGYLIFDPYTKEDFKIFGAVATAYNFFNPESPRTKQLYSFAQEALKVSRAAEQGDQVIDAEVAEDMDHFNIELPNNMGGVKSLTECKGKVVLLNFTAYQSDFSPALNIQLNEIYEKYAARGLEIFQVSFDSDEHFWKVSASNLPWIAVRDPRTIYSPYASMYNVQQLPSMFVINRQGEIVRRVENSAELENIVKNLL